MNILTEIYANKRSELAQRKQVVSLAAMEARARSVSPPRDFVAALIKRQPSLTAARQPGFNLPVPGLERTITWPALIAEIKFASPSRGLLLPGADPCRLAELYRQNGASAISVLTDERYFHGHLEYLLQIASLPAHLPLLCKDFIFDVYQVFEARAAGADAILLIVAGLSKAKLCQLHRLALELGMTPLVEVHTLAELHIALECAPHLLGINNRNLQDFSVDLATSLTIRSEVPPGITVVAESGIHTSADVRVLAQAGVDAILVGEALVTAPDIPAQVRALSG